MDIIKQFFKFGFIGAINTVLHLLIYWICVGIGIHYIVSNAIGFIVTVVISYVFNNIYTFRLYDKAIIWSVKSFLKVFISYFLTGIAINSLLLLFWNDIVGINENLSPIINLLITVPTNFLLNKLWAYRSK